MGGAPFAVLSFPLKGFPHALANGVPLQPAERAMIEVAIQMDLIAPEQPEALVEKGRTPGE